MAHEVVADVFHADDEHRVDTQSQAFADEVMAGAEPLNTFDRKMHVFKPVTDIACSGVLLGVQNS
ncbi:MAG: hypothetical protein OXF88_18775 [Rhodobacteraceae bacterium]|nr:hypothetical protein [Paracoccaceae bacterium]